MKLTSKRKRKQGTQRQKTRSMERQPQTFAHLDEENDNGTGQCNLGFKRRSVQAALAFRRISGDAQRPEEPAGEGRKGPVSGGETETSGGLLV